MQSYSTETGGNGPVGYDTTGSTSYIYNYNNNPQASYPQSTSTMSYSTQQQPPYSSPQAQLQQPQEQGDPYSVEPPKPDSYSFGVTAQRKEEPVREEKMYSEDDEWQPSAMMLCFIFWIVLVVAGGVGVGIYFANDRRGKNRPIVGPTAAPSMMPSMAPMVCNICGDEDNGQVISNDFGFVSIPNLGGFSCRQLQQRGENQRIPEDVCSDQVQIASVQNTCGCMVPPTEAPTTSLPPTPGDGTTPAPNFVCPICGSDDSGITNPNGILELPGTGEATTCQDVQDQAVAGQISPNVCFDGTLTAAVQLNCVCVFQCNLCGSPEEEAPSGTITNVNATLTVGGFSQTCGQWQTLAKAGQITKQQCATLQPLALDPCQCVFTNTVL